MLSAALPILLGVSAAFVASERTAPTLAVRDQCAATLGVAESVTNRLQSHYFDPITGEWSELWTDANTLEDIHNLMLAAGTTTWDDLADISYIGRIANLGLGTSFWSDILGGSYDDAQWVMLALWKMADYRNAHGEDASAFLESAEQIYTIVEAQWDDTCNGGVWWSSAKTYKNAITNHLFLYTSAEGYLRNGNATYLANAEKAWAWLYSSGIRNSENLWNDGLNLGTPCTNNGETEWTYNQAVVASGLAALYAATGSSNETYLTQAELTLDATITYLTSDDILKESCDSPTDSTCDTDQQIFKGVWTKHLQYYLDMAPARASKYASFLGSQYSAVYHYGIDGDEDVCNVWYAADQGGAVFSAPASTSGLAALNAAAKYGPCENFSK